MLKLNAKWGSPPPQVLKQVAGEELLDPLDRIWAGGLYVNTGLILGIINKRSGGRKMNGLLVAMDVYSLRLVNMYPLRWPRCWSGRRAKGADRPPPLFQPALRRVNEMLWILKRSSLSFTYEYNLTLTYECQSEASPKIDRLKSN